MENIIQEIILDCQNVTPPLERYEIAQHVVDQVSQDIRKEVYLSLEELVARGLLVQVSDASGRQGYRLAEKSDRQH